MFKYLDVVLNAWLVTDCNLWLHVHVRYGSKCFVRPSEEKRVLDNKHGQLDQNQKEVGSDEDRMNE